MTLEFFSYTYGPTKTANLPAFHTTLSYFLSSPAVENTCLRYKDTDPSFYPTYLSFRTYRNAYYFCNLVGGIAGEIGTRNLEYLICVCVCLCEGEIIHMEMDAWWWVKMEWTSCLVECVADGLTGLPVVEILRWGRRLGYEYESFDCFCTDDYVSQDFNTTLCSIRLGY